MQGGVEDNANVIECGSKILRHYDKSPLSPVAKGGN